MDSIVAPIDPAPVAPAAEGVVPLLTVMGARRGMLQSLADGSVSVAGFRLAWDAPARLPDGFRRMVRESAYDVAEMAVTTYLVAREHDVPLIALPIFPARGFHGGAIRVRKSGRVRSANCLEAARVAVGGGYLGTTGVWARGLLLERYGVDLSQVTWVVTGEEHVAGFIDPANVVRLQAGVALTDLLVRGAVTATIGLTSDDPDIVPLIPDSAIADLSAFEAEGMYPINHCLVVREETLHAHPGLMNALITAAILSKRQYLGSLLDNGERGPEATLHTTILGLGRDPLPLGLEENRPMLERLVVHARAQGILKKAVDLDRLFLSEFRVS